jgi:gamma-glutamyltranspeptidase / glutathione hydrolase
MAPNAVPAQSHRPLVSAVNHVVAAGHYMAAQAGFQMLEAGGNAIDAGVAAGIATAVLEGVHVSFAGVAPIIIYLADAKKVTTISGLGTWPAAANAEYFRTRHGGKIPLGVERTVVPAAPDAWITALEHFGTMSFADVAAPAIRFASQGFPVYPHMAKIIRSYEAVIRSYPSSSAIYLPGGRPPEIGDVFVQSDLAATLTFLADQEKSGAARGGRAQGFAAARDAFYRGDIAERIVRFQEEQGGLLTASDLAEFRVGIEPPVRFSYGDAEILTCGPWCQGPMLLQELSLLDPAELRSEAHNGPGYIHRLTEAIKLAAADRERYYGDPRKVDVPLDALLSEAYARGRRALIDPARAIDGMPEAGRVEGRPWGAQADSLRTQGIPIAADESTADTSYLCAVDRHGNVFSATPSDGNGTSPVIPGTGFVASARGSQSRTDAAHPSSIAPGKRPRLTPNPAIALFPGRAVMPFGTPGGDVQTQAMLQCLLNHVLFGMDLQSAVEAPRFASFSFPSSFYPNEYRPNVLALESRIARESGESLAGLGHAITWWPELAWEAGSVCMIRHDFKTGVKSGAADPRRTAYAVGW